MFTSRQLLCAFSFIISTTVLTASEPNELGNNLLDKARVLYDKYEPTVSNALFHFPLNMIGLDSEKKRIEKTRALVVPESIEERKAQLSYVGSEDSKIDRMKGYSNLFLFLSVVVHKLRISPTHLPVVMLVGSGTACLGIAASKLPHYDIPMLYEMYEEHKKEKEENEASSGPSLGEWYPNPKRGLHGLRG